MKKRINTIHLTKREQALFDVLLKYRGQTVMRDGLLAVIGKDETVSNVLDVHIKNLRRKMADVEIESIRGVGYMMI